jgi:dTDP-4-dehydrorhamnose reductase
MILRILLIGKNGQLGAELEKSLVRIGELQAIGRKDCDLSKPQEVRSTIRHCKPQLIVNAAAYTAVDLAESEEATARAINADAPALLAEEANLLGAAMVHFSTDYVFDGRKGSPYEESDPVNPLNVYGKSKLLGEEAIRASGVSHLIFRTEWVYGVRGRNFLLTILKLASEREELRIVNDQIGAPTWCREIAQATSAVLRQLLLNDHVSSRFSEFSGTYHMSAGGAATWYDFARAILDESSRMECRPRWVQQATNGKPLISKRILPITTTDYPTPARRPSYSLLSNSRLRERFGIDLRDWRASLSDDFRDG